MEGYRCLQLAFRDDEASLIVIRGTMDETTIACGTWMIFLMMRLNREST